MGPHGRWVEYIGKWPLCGIRASSTPLSARVFRYDRESFCWPYMSIFGMGSAGKRSSRSPLSERSTIDVKIGLTGAARTLYGRPAAYRALP